MKLLLDMGVSPATAAHLRSLGHDAVHLHELGLDGLPDQNIVTKATAEGRVVVTYDLGFGRILALQKLANPSVILFRVDRWSTARMNLFLPWLLEHYAEELRAGAIVVVESDDPRIRVRVLPIA